MRSFYKKGSKGFTLVEIMIVVAIIALLAAIAIPNLLRARHNANETAAIGAMRTISTACESYRAAQTPPAYPPNLGVLGVTSPLTGPAYIPAALAGATFPGASRQGYWYSYVNNAFAGTYTLQGTPQTIGTTGTRRFYVDQTGVIRANPTGPAGPFSAEIQ